MVPWFCLIHSQPDSILESHTGDNIAALLRASLADFGVLEKTMAICTDNGANFVLAVELLEKLGVRCAGHNLHLLVRPHGLDKVLPNVSSFLSVFDVLGSRARGAANKAS